MSWLNAKRGQNILIACVLVVGGGNLWATHDQTDAGIAAQRAEQQRYEHGQQVDAARARQAQVKGAVPVCMALLKLSEVRGSHGTTSATYGIHLETAFQGVYRASGCPKILATVTPPAAASP